MRRPVIGSERLFRGTREQRLRRFKMIPVRFLLPNIITLLALCSGVTAIRLGIEGRFELAVGAVIIAVVLDAIDGRLARLLKGSSRFGAELVRWPISSISAVGILDGVGRIVALQPIEGTHKIEGVDAHAGRDAVRLLLVTDADDPDKPAWKMNFFVGIPAPAGAGLAIAPLYLGFLGLVPDGRAAAGLVLVWVALVAAGMVSRLPTFSGKTLGQRVHRDLVPPIIAGAVLALIMLILHLGNALGHRARLSALFLWA